MRFIARTVGVDAASTLYPGRSGVIAASFPRSCYVRFGGDLICIGNAAIGSGPINVPCYAHPTPDWRAIAPMGRAVRVTHDSVIMDGLWKLELGRAPVWWAARGRTWSTRDAARGLAALTERLPLQLPAGGLGELLGQGRGAPGVVARAATSAVAELQAWIAHPSGHPTTPERVASALLGLGPGLTPSGDDFLAGCMAALHAAGRPGLARRLWQAIAARAPNATNDISRAHLQAAARGRLGEDLHGLLIEIVGGNRESLARRMAELQERTPKHSSWDCLVGICTTLRSMNASPNAARSAQSA